VDSTTDNKKTCSSVSSPRLSGGEVAILLLSGGLLVACFWWTGRRLAIRWEQQSGYYSHGWLVPVVTVTWLWYRRRALAAASRRPSGMGFLILVPSLIVHVLSVRMNWGAASGFALLGALLGLVLTLFGRQVFRIALLPMSFLFFMVPLPESVIDRVSIPLKVAAAASAKSVVELMGITIIRSGSYLDIASGYPEPVWQRLVVDDVCSGLKFLIALTAFGALYAGAFSIGRRSARLVLFLAAMPIALGANVIRVILMVLVAFFWSTRALENDLLHYGLGIMVFVVAYVCLFILDSALVKAIGAARREEELVPQQDPAGIIGRTTSSPLPATSRTGGWAWLAVPLLALAAGATAWALRVEQGIPSKGILERIPSTIGEWVGEESPISDYEKKVLGTQDVRAIRYTSQRGDQVRLLIVVAAQARRRTHDPQECYTGEGFHALSSNVVTCAVKKGGTAIAIPFREVVFAQGDQVRLVWYVFKGGARFDTSHLRHHIGLAIARLKGDDVADVLLRVDTPAAGADLDHARDALRRFLSETLPSILYILP